MRVDDRRVSEGSSLCLPGCGGQGNRVGVSASRRLQSVINFRRDLLPARKERFHDAC